MGFLFYLTMALVIAHLILYSDLIIELQDNNHEVWQKAGKPSRWFFGPTEFIFVYKFLIAGGYRGYALSASASRNGFLLQWLLPSIAVSFTIWAITDG